MQSDTPTPPVHPAMLWAGRIVSALPVLGLIFSGVLKLVQPVFVLKEFERLELPFNLAVGIGILELACTALYAFPKTSVLGAILLTGYLGGAILTHLRIDDPFIPPIVMGVLVWLGLFLRDPRVRALIPWKS